MRLKNIFSLLMVLVVEGLSGQGYYFDLSYQNLYAKQWNEANQVYNFTRPFLPNAQPNITHGVQAEAGYYFNSSKVSRHGVSLAYSRYSSVAQNENFKSGQYLHLVEPGYFREWQTSNNGQGFVGQVGVAVVLGGLFRRINDEALIVDEASAKAWGIGGKLKAQLAYRFAGAGTVSWAPFVGLNYLPYYYAPGTEAIINQTTGMILDDGSALLRVEFGIRLALFGR